MNFDELKKGWQDQEYSDAELTINLSKKREASTAIDIIRKKMRKEFWSSNIVMVLFLCLIIFQFFIDDAALYTLLVVGIYAAAWILLISSYYYTYFQFYKKSYHLEYNSLENLLWFSYQMKLHLATYKSISISSAIIGFGGSIMYKALEEGGNGDKYKLRLGEVFQSPPNTEILKLLFMAFAFIVLFVIVYAFISLTIRRYKQHVDKIDLSIKYLSEFGDSEPAQTVAN